MAAPPHLRRPLACRCLAQHPRWSVKDTATSAVWWEATGTARRGAAGAAPAAHLYIALSSVKAHDDAAVHISVAAADSVQRSRARRPVHRRCSALLHAKGAVITLACDEGRSLIIH
eukprot:421935-Amphidinium_carterae.3